MKETIFQKLKTTYSPLGLGDEILSAQAEMLASMGFVTEENVDSVITSQKNYLESLQKQNDTRVTNAKKKLEDSLKKAHEEELKKQKELADKVNADFLKYKEAHPEVDPKKDKGGEDIPDWFKAYKENAEKERQAMLDANKKQSDALEALQKENADFKAKEALAKRNNFILEKAKEFKIPQSRIDEGFAIASDADDAAITSYLEKVAKNTAAMQLPNLGGGMKKTSIDAPDEKALGEIAASLIK